MRGDQLTRQWLTIRAIKVDPDGLTVTEIAQREETGIRTIYHDLETFQMAGFPPHRERAEWNNRWALIGTFKFKTSPPFTLTELMSLFLYKDLVRVPKGTPFNPLESVFKKCGMAGELCSHVATIENNHEVKNSILLRDISGDLQSSFTCVCHGSIWRT